MPHPTYITIFKRVVVKYAMRVINSESESVKCRQAARPNWPLYVRAIKFAPGFVINSIVVSVVFSGFGPIVP
jgi:hypothetical protein